MEKIIEDEELGLLIVRTNARAKRLVFRVKPDAIHVSVPLGLAAGELDQALEELRGKLLAQRQSVSPLLIDLNYSIDTEYFKLKLVSGTGKQFVAKTEFGKMEVVCPLNVDFKDKELQTWLRKVIGEAMRRNAKVLLPSWLSSLSEQSGLPYASVKINSSQGRWGSCSMKKDINLSYYLVLLPKHLIEYVLLHELCHTREMNHGERFWALLNQHTAGKALALREELKMYRTMI